MNKTIKILSLIVIILLLFLSYNFGFKKGEQSILTKAPEYLENTQSEKNDFSVFWEAWNRIENDFLYQKDIDYQEMIYGAIKGMISSLDDPYTAFFAPKEAEEFERELSGKYKGVGMEITVKEGILTVVSPLENTPAQRADLMPGDKILKVDDITIKDMPIDEAVQLIRGPEGTEVTLLVNRKSWDEPKNITLVREVIKIPTFKFEIKETEQGTPVAYIKMYQFNKILNKELRDEIRDILNSSAKGIILDLRNNPGGYLHVAENVAGWFLEKGEIIVWQKTGSKEESFTSSGPGIFSEYPIVVLINKGSASGAEILAGALRDNKGAKLVGEKSFGKGSVQEQMNLNDNSSIKITVSEWLTPSKHSIRDEGLEPDVEVEMTEEDYLDKKDKQLEKALEVFEEII